MSSSNPSTTHIRPATADDGSFIVSLAPRFAAFELPRGRNKRDITKAIRSEVDRALHDPKPGEHVFVAEDADGNRTGFVHLRVERDFLSGQRACHISNIAVAKGHDGNGIGAALLAHAREWAQAHKCKLLTLNVFPGNRRARALYEHAGFATEMLRMATPLR